MCTARSCRLCTLVSADCAGIHAVGEHTIRAGVLAHSVVWVSSEDLGVHRAIGILRAFLLKAFIEDSESQILDKALISLVRDVLDMEKLVKESISCESGQLNHCEVP